MRISFKEVMKSLIQSIINKTKEHKMRIFIITMLSLIVVNIGTSKSYTVKKSAHSLEISQAVKTIEPPTGKAVIYIGQFYDHFVHEQTASKISVDGKFIGNVGNKSFVYVVVEPGKHVITVEGLLKGREIVNAEAGEKYYVGQNRLIGIFPWFGYGLSQIKELTELHFFDECQLSADCVILF